MSTDHGTRLRPHEGVSPEKWRELEQRLTRLEIETGLKPDTRTLFHLWEMPAHPEDPIWTHPQALAVAKVEAVESPAAAAAEAVVEIRHLSEAYRSLGRGYTDYAVGLDGWGDIGTPLLTDPRDGPGPWCHLGVRRWRGWSRTFFEAMYEGLIEHGLPLPARFLVPLRERISRDLGLWFHTIENDRRADSTLLSEGRTVGSLLDQFGMPEIDEDLPFWHASNTEWRSWASALLLSAESAAVDLALVVPAMRCAGGPETRFSVQGLQPGERDRSAGPDARRPFAFSEINALPSGGLFAGPLLGPVRCDMQWPEWQTEYAPGDANNLDEIAEHVAAGFAADEMRSFGAGDAIPWIATPGEEHYYLGGYENNQAIYRMGYRLAARLFATVRNAEHPHAVVMTRRAMNFREWDTVHRCLG